MKKIISVICAFVFIISAVCVAVPAAGAAETLDIVLTNASGVKNDEIKIDFNITQNPGFYSFCFFLYYDPDTFILRDVEVNGELKKLGSLYDTKTGISPAEVTGPLATRILEYFPQYGVDPSDKNLKLILFEKKNIDKNIDFTGTAMTLTFQIMGIADDGEHTIGLIPDPYSIIDFDGNDVNFTWKNSIVAVGNTEAPDVPSDDTTPVTGGNDTLETPITTNEYKGGSNERPPDDIINPDDPKDSDSQNTPSGQVTTAPETFVDASGTTFYTDLDGETVPYDEEAFLNKFHALPGKVPESDLTNDNTTTGEDIKVNDEKSDKSKKNLTVLYILIAVIILLAAAAVLIFVLVLKPNMDKKKNDKDADNKSDKE